MRPQSIRGSQNKIINRTFPYKYTHTNAHKHTILDRWLPRVTAWSTCVCGIFEIKSLTSLFCWMSPLSRNGSVWADNAYPYSEWDKEKTEKTPTALSDQTAELFVVGCCEWFPLVFLFCFRSQKTVHFLWTKYQNPMESRNHTTIVDSTKWTRMNISELYCTIQK